MEFFCELWIRWDINIPSEIFRNISKKKKKENIDRSIRLLYRTLSVSRRTNNTENGGLFGDYRPRRGRKRERGKGNYRSVCYHSPVIISLRKILCIRLICFCWNPILLKRYCNDKLNKRFKDYLSLQPSVCFIYCYCCFFFFLSNEWVLSPGRFPPCLWRFIGNKSLAIVHPLHASFLESDVREVEKDEDFSTAGRVETNCPIINSRKLCLNLLNLPVEKVNRKENR